MLEGLNKVNWASISHTGDAPSTEIPALIRRVAEGDETNNNSLWGHPDALAELFPDRGDDAPRFIYFIESTQYIVPFLIEILPYIKTRFQRRILSNFHELLNDSFSVYWSGIKSPLVGKRHIFRRYKGIWDGAEAIWSGYSVYKLLTDNSEIGVRSNAIKLLGMFTHEARELIPFLFEKLSIETTGIVSKSIIQGIVDLVVSSPYADQHSRTKWGNQLLPFFIGTSDNDIKTQIVLAYVQIARINIFLPESELPIVVDDRITHWINEPVRSQFSSLKSDYNDIEKLIEALYLIDTANITELLLHENLSPELAHYGVRTLVDKVFPRIDRSHQISEYGYPYSVKPDDMRFRYASSWGKKRLSSRQSDILKLIVDLESFWQLPTNLFSFFYDLPDDREELRKLITES